MMDKLRACIVANYYASAGLLKVGEVNILVTRFLNIYRSRGVEFTWPKEKKRNCFAFS